jgi:hypothetical protein
LCPVPCLWYWCCLFFFRSVAGGASIQVPWSVVQVPIKMNIDYVIIVMCYHAWVDPRRAGQCIRFIENHERLGGQKVWAVG